MAAVVARMNTRRTRDRISVDQRAFDELLSLVHEHTFHDGWDAGKRFVAVEQKAMLPSSEGRP
jgi:hypothetical protein